MSVQNNNLPCLLIPEHSLLSDDPPNLTESNHSHGAIQDLIYKGSVNMNKL